ncbi:hypothetical protein EIP91_008140 [Steccherinum ochraceum]|uniref:Nephrocystin 3-like N-terminal domain-containing protein n=1 Tax=Steccherinum ochraceum TaxID=92696 RepID=A0A4R0RH27_9APHY|nr:hypothetical protein EIP91_008140 [Steccherinum ochraceum]
MAQRRRNPTKRTWWKELSLFSGKQNRPSTPSELPPRPPTPSTSVYSTLPDQSVSSTPTSSGGTFGSSQIPNASSSRPVNNPDSTPLAPASPQASEPLLGVACPGSSLPTQSPESPNATWHRASNALIGFAKITGRAIDTALPLVAAGVDTFPIAKGVIGGLVAIVALAKTVHDNREKLDQTQQRLERLHGMVESSGPQIKEDWAEHGVRLAEVLRQVVDMKNEGRVTALLSSKHDQETILDCINDMNAIFRDFNFQIQLRVFDSMAKVEETVIVIEQGNVALPSVFSHTGVVHEGISTDSRMQLERLKHVADAAYGKGQQGGKRTSCLRDTRKKILGKLDSWLLDPKDFRVFWLNGMAGTGKSTIADSLYKAAEQHGAHVAAFFCSRDLDSTRDVFHIIPSLAYQLSVRFGAYRAALVASLKGESYPENFGLQDQIEKLILKPLSTVSVKSSHLIVLLADAMDECQSDGDLIRTFVDLLLSHAGDFCEARIKFFLTSRPAHEISQNFKLDELRRHQRLVLHDADFMDVQHDLDLYVRYQLRGVQMKDPSFTFSQTQVTMISKASVPLFIFAATVCAHISGRHANLKGRVNYAKRLTQVISQISTNKPNDGSRTMEALDGLYRMVLESAFKIMNEEAEEFDDADRQTQAEFVIASILTFFEPLGLAAMSTLFGSGYDCQKVQDLLYHLYSIIDVSEDDVQPVRALHASLYDYLTDPGRRPPFLISPSATHAVLAAISLERMLDIITHDNVCGLQVGEDQDGIKDFQSHIQDGRIRNALPALRYACQHWSQHLSASSCTPDSRLLEALERFTSTCLLRWIEMLVIFGLLGKAVPMISTARKWLSTFKIPQTASNATSLLSDLERMVFEFHDTIVMSPIQVYISAFPFIPQQCALYLDYHDIIDPSLQLLKVVSGIDNTWSPIQSTISVPDEICDGIMCMSPNSRTLALMTRRDGLVFWDSVGGGPLSVLEDGRLGKASLVFHSDHCLLAVSRSPRPFVWSVNMRLNQLKEVPLDLERAREVFVGEDVYSDAMYKFSRTASFSSDGSRLAGLVSGRGYLLTCVLKEGFEGEGEAVNDLAFVPEHCLQLTHLPPVSLHDFNQLCIRWSNDSSVIALRVEWKAYLCTLPCCDDHCQYNLSPIKSGVGSSHCAEIVWAEGDGYLACRSDSALTVYAISRAATGACQATEVWTKEFDTTLLSVAFSPDAQFMTTGHVAGIINFHAVKDSASLSTLRVSNRSVERVVYSPDGRRIICATLCKVLVLDADAFVRTQHSDDAPHRHIPLDGLCISLECSPNETTVSTAYYTSPEDPPWIGVWDAAQGHLFATIAIKDVLRGAYNTAVMYTHSGVELLVVVPDHAYWYNLDVCRHAHASLKLEPRLTLPPFTGMEFVPRGQGSAVSPNNGFVFLLQRPRQSRSDSDEGSRTGAIFDTKSGKLVWSRDSFAVLKDHSRSLHPVWSPSGNMIACGFDGTDIINLWSFPELPGSNINPRSVGLPSRENRYLRGLDFNLSGKELLAILVDRSGIFICSWDVESGEVLRKVNLNSLRSSRVEVLTPHSGGMLVPTTRGTFKAEDLLAMGDSSPLPSPHNSLYSRYRVEVNSNEEGWAQDFRGRKVFRLPQSCRGLPCRFTSYGNLLAAAPEDSNGRMLIMRILTPQAQAT